MKYPIDVLMLAYDDFANTGYRFWMCLRELGLNAIMFKGVSHPFDYPAQAPVHPSLTVMPLDSSPILLRTRGLDDLIKCSRVIHFVASTFVFEKSTGIYAKNKIVVQHGGTPYRREPNRVNFIFNQIADATIIQCPDLLGLGAKDEHLIYYPVDTDFIKPDYNRKDPDKIILGHFPSNPGVKNTKAIVDLIDYIKMDLLFKERFEYVGSDVRVTWERNLERMRQCDVIIETCQPDLEGKPYGEWGNTALEAAAMGAVVVTNSHHQDLYEVEYEKDCPIQVANDEDQLYEQLTNIITMSDDELWRLKVRSRSWAVRNHSYSATAKRLWNKVYKDFFLEK